MLGIQTSIVKKSYIFVLFQGGGVLTTCPPSGSAHAPQNKEIILILIDRPLARNLSSGLELAQWAQVPDSNLNFNDFKIRVAVFLFCIAW